MKKVVKKPESALLRKKAEKLLKKKKPKDGWQLFETNTLKLINELEVHQVELELQNEELILARNAAQEAAEKYTELYDFAPVGYFTLSKEGKIIDLNLRGALMLDNERSMLKQNLFSAFVSADTKEYFNNFLEGVFNNKSKVSGEIILTVGRKASMYVLLTGFKAAEGENCFLTAVDITDRKIAEKELDLYREYLEELVSLRTEELNTSNISLEKEIIKEKEIESMLRSSLAKEKELNEIKSRFITTASHEFRTPLTSVLLSAELIQRYGDRWGRDKKEEHTDRIRNSVKYLTKLLEDILTQSKGESGDIRFNPEIGNLRLFCEECIEETIALTNNTHKLKLIFNSDKEEFLLDPKLIRFILNNLLSNSIKYSPKGGSSVLSISAIGKELIIEVSDEGIGIPGNEIDKIFDSFYRAKNADVIPGTGLGLAIVKHSVELHGGEISVNSILNKGTTFTVRIPIVD